LIECVDIRLRIVLDHLVAPYELDGRISFHLELLGYCSVLVAVNLHEVYPDVLNWGVTCLLLELTPYWQSFLAVRTPRCVEEIQISGFLASACRIFPAFLYVLFVGDVLRIETGRNVTVVGVDSGRDEYRRKD